MFTYTITMLILVHVVLLGIEVDLSATLPIQKMPDWLLDGFTYYDRPFDASRHEV